MKWHCHRPRRILVVLAMLTSGASAAEPKQPLETPSASGFQLTDGKGRRTEIESPTKELLTVVCFLGTECPLARHYGPRLSQLATEFAARQVRFVGVNSNSQDSQQDVDDFCEEYEISFPILKDPANKVADVFGARHMAEVFVLDQSLAVRYRGRIDDQYAPGVSRPQSTRHDLQIALDELLSGKSVSVPRTETTGCAIGRVKTPQLDAEVTFCRHVAKILNQHCVECHRPGEIGPFSLTDYNEVTGWGDTILETIDSGRMPPWNADPHVGHFQNARVMSDDDKATLRTWIETGMPYGDSSELPPQPEFATGWQFSREPDLVLAMRDRPYRVPAAGSVEYQYFVVDPQLTEDRWVSAAQIIPGNRLTVHHAIVFIRPPDGTDVRGVGYLVGYVPGQRQFSMPPGYARRVPAGSKFVFQMHYTPNGKPQDDLTQVGMTFVPESDVTHEVLTVMGIDQEFEIPPQAADFVVEGNAGWFPKRAELLAIVPHMHVRGKAFQARARRGESTETLLDVPRYDFNWQHIYALSEPLPLKEIDQLEFTVHFDNSRQNPANPDPSQAVYWGDQTWEEMAVAFFEIADPRDAAAEPEPQRNKQKLVVKMAPEKAMDESEQKFVADFFQQFDRNRDQMVERMETPLSFRHFGFYRYDQNHDGKLDRAEMEAAAKSQRRKR